MVLVFLFRTSRKDRLLIKANYSVAMRSMFIIVSTLSILKMMVKNIFSGEAGMVFGVLN